MVVDGFPEIGIDHSLDVPKYGPVVGHITWGVNWAFLTNAHRPELIGRHRKILPDHATTLQKTLVDNGIPGEDGSLIDHVEAFLPTARIYPDDGYNRFPCDAGTSAKGVFNYRP